MKTPQEAEVNGLFNFLYFFLYKIAFYVVYLGFSGMTDYYLILKTDKAEVNGLWGAERGPPKQKGRWRRSSTQGCFAALGVCIVCLVLIIKSFIVPANK